MIPADFIDLAKAACICAAAPGDDERQMYCRWALEAMGKAKAAVAWRNPLTDPPTLTGKILVWMSDVGPAIVNVEERWMCFLDGNDEAGPTDPTEWDAWREIDPPKESSK